jgi:hypothetical protein
MIVLFVVLQQGKQEEEFMTSVPNVENKKSRNYKKEYQKRKTRKEIERQSSLAAWPQYVKETTLEHRVVNGITYWVLYKAVGFNFTSLYAPRRFGDLEPYKPGNVVKVKHWNTNRELDCAAGLHVATYDWVKNNYANGWGRDYRYIKVLVEEKDIVCLPTSYTGSLLHKIRVKKLYVAEEV